MSQPNTSFDFNDSTNDPFSPCLRDETVTQEHSNAGYAARVLPPLLSRNSEVFDGSIFRIDNSSIATITSFNSTAASTPDLSNYSLGHRLTPASYYPTPSSTTDLYSPELQYPSETQLIHQEHPVCQQTDSTPLHLSHHHSRAYQPTHRRSLSQGDADQIATFVQQHPNPVFSRLLAPKNRVYTQGDEGKVQRRVISQEGQGQKKSRRPGHIKCRSATSIPGGNMVGECEPNMSSRIQSPTDLDFRSSSTTGIPIQLTGSKGTVSSAPYFTHMSHQEQLRSSQRVIELGAMAVLHKSSVDYMPLLTNVATQRSRLDRQSNSVEPSSGNDSKDEGTSERISILKKLEEVENHLQDEHEPGAVEKGLIGCEMIRMILNSKSRTDGKKEARQGSMTEPVIESSPNPDRERETPVVPSAVFAESDNELYDSTTDDDLFSLMVEELQDADVEKVLFDHA